MQKERLDIILLNKGLVTKRGEATLLITKGKVKVNGKIINKPGTKIDLDAEIDLEKQEITFVSRGGHKLLGAIKSFKLDFQDKICLDIGASTGGFTDCMLKHGARKVYAVDVGYGQLDWGLRNDPRVECIERTNVRHWQGLEIKDKIDTVVIDVSFISLSLILPQIKNIYDCRDARAGVSCDSRSFYEIVALIKPQFEVGKDKIGKNGVVREQKYRDQALEKIKKVTEDLGFKILGTCESPLKGPKGNVEYFLCALGDVHKNTN